MKNVIKTTPDEDEDCPTEISSPYWGSDLELYIEKKFLIEHKKRDDCGFPAKELSFNNDNLTQICEVINRLIEDQIIILSTNTEPKEIENEICGTIDWKTVKTLENNHLKNDLSFVWFDVEVLDELKLKGRLDISIDEFMSDREIYYGKKYSYKKQRSMLLNQITEKQKNVFLKSSENPNLSILKTILSLEKEGIVAIKELGNEAIKFGKNELETKWKEKDNPYAKIQILKNSFRGEISLNELQFSVAFNESQGILILNSHKVKIHKFSDQYDLLRIIFEDKKESLKEWLFSEISEIFDRSANLPDKKFYNAVYQINQKVMRDVGITFFITTNQSCKINQENIKSFL